MTEHAVRFGASGSLIGVITDPPDADAARGRPAIILLGAGLVHHVGPHRLYVKLARMLARQGYVVLRFDFSGIGDSGVRRDNLPLERSAVAETQEAMNWLSTARRVDTFVLMAVCSGAGFSFRTACADRRVVGVSLINAAGHRWGTSDELNRTLMHHYLRMLRSRSFRGKNWRKLLRLDFDRHTILRTMAARIKALFGRRSPVARKEAHEAVQVIAGFESLMARGVRVLIVYSEGDEGWDYYQLFLRDRLAGLLSSSGLELTIVAGANHTFTLLPHQRDLFGILGRWVERITP